MILHLKSLTARLENHNGQMAIFVALIFQVLFVAFAMAINIGLVVHDKINLQNAVDLAAYYAAQRQAEQLNVIAHQNYQIRQSFKLLSWRYNVLGVAGQDLHPTKSGAGTFSEDAFVTQPRVCVAYRPLFSEVGGGNANAENMCRREIVRVPQIKLPGIIAGFNPINIIFQARVQNLVTQLKGLCKNYGAYNFYFAAASMAAFRRDQANRKQVMYAIAANMSKPFETMADLDGAPVETGVQKTLQKNLTFENASSLQGIQTFNSLQGIAREDWLHELPISFTMLYTDILNNSQETCESETKTVDIGPNEQGFLPGGVVQDLLNFVGNPPAGDINQMSLGVEKNPWIVVYSKVTARTKPREIFWPFGEPVTLEATAYAQPFGGRIGPWFYDKWSNGAKASSGARVDPLTPPLAGANLPANSDELLPNHSRYPGDPTGLHSIQAQAAIPSVNGLAGNVSDYVGIADFGPGLANDIVAFNPAVPGGGQIRQTELAAIVPDLFDLAYYSIEPRFNQMYLPKLIAARNALGIGNVPIRGDLGSREADPGRGSIGIFEQMKYANGEGLPSPILSPRDYWQVRDREQMLVDWVHADSFEEMEAVNTARFGVCTQNDDGKIPASGSCISGGRTGYSVKLVSPEYLRSGELELGGPGQAGAILNPPPEGP